MTSHIPMVGTLMVHVHSGENLLDVQTFGKQDPYVVMKCGKEKFKTPVCQNGGRNPNWDVSFCFNLSGHDDTLHFKVNDAEVGKDRKIGRADIPLQQLLSQNGRKNITLVADYNFSLSAGSLWISTNFTPGNVAHYSDKHKEKEKDKHKNKQKGYISNEYPGNVAQMTSPTSHFPGVVTQPTYGHPTQAPYPGPAVAQPQSYAQQPYYPHQQQYPPSGQQYAQIPPSQPTYAPSGYPGNVPYSQPQYAPQPHAQPQYAPQPQAQPQYAPQPQAQPQYVQPQHTQPQPQYAQQPQYTQPPAYAPGNPPSQYAQPPLTQPQPSGYPTAPPPQQANYPGIYPRI